jgi:hypothetical protein
MAVGPKRFRNLIVAGAVMMVALSMNLAPASANHRNHVIVPTDYKQGHGSFVATSNPQPPTVKDFCADYREYTAELAFDHSPVAGATATVTSAHNPLKVWGEFTDGTYANTTGALANVPCPGRDLANGQGKGGAPIDGFIGTLTTSTGAVCELGDRNDASRGNYRRGHMGNDSPSLAHPLNPELNIQFTFTKVTYVSGPGTCPAASSSAPFVLKTTIVHVHPDPLDPSRGSYVTACNSPIAPQTCELDHQEHPSQW